MNAWSVVTGMLLGVSMTSLFISVPIEKAHNTCREKLTALEAQVSPQPGFLYALSNGGTWDRVRVGDSAHILASGGDIYVQEDLTVEVRAMGSNTSSSYRYRKLTEREREALLLEAWMKKPIEVTEPEL